MQEFIKDLLLVSLGGGIGMVAMCLLQAGKLADKKIETMNRERNDKE